MTHLTIRVRFIAHSYSGIRIREDRREELDWPPSPGRLHEALLSASLLGVQRSEAELKQVFEAFRWLERLDPPEIWASPQDGAKRTRPRVAIPQNNRQKSDWEKKPALLADLVKAAPTTGEPLELWYRWLLPADGMPETHRDILSDAAARVSYFGRGEDRTELDMIDPGNEDAQHLIRWHPDAGGQAELWLPKSGTTDGLERRHQDLTKLKPRESRVPAQRWMRRVRYSDGSPGARQPVAVAIFKLFDDTEPDGNALACDPEFAGLWREMLRCEIIKLAEDEGYWDNPELASELLSGHVSRDKPATRPHLAIVPLPSVDAARKADGRVRRIALLGYCEPGVVAEALPIYDTLFRALDEQVLTHPNIQPHGKPLPVRLREQNVSQDKIWAHLTSASHVWCSVIPVAISRGFKVPKLHPDGRELSSNERHRRMLAEWEKLLRTSLAHIGLPAEVAETTHIECSRTPLVPRSQHAERYRPKGEKAVLTHVRLEFPIAIRGPLLLGDRRYMGLGLFVPVDHA